MTGKRAWMLTWSPDPEKPKGDWSVKKACEDVQNGIQHEEEWGSKRSDFVPQIDDDVFLMKVGRKTKIKGIVAHGRVNQIGFKRNLILHFINQYGDQLIQMEIQEKEKAGGKSRNQLCQN